jgi:hypothetical protein
LPLLFCPLQKEDDFDFSIGVSDYKISNNNISLLLEQGEQSCCGNTGRYYLSNIGMEKSTTVISELKPRSSGTSRYRYNHKKATLTGPEDLLYNVHNQHQVGKGQVLLLEDRDCDKVVSEESRDDIGDDGREQVTESPKNAQFQRQQQQLQQQQNRNDNVKANEKSRFFGKLMLAGRQNIQQEYQDPVKILKNNRKKKKEKKKSKTKTQNQDILATHSVQPSSPTTSRNNKITGNSPNESNDKGRTRSIVEQRSLSSFNRGSVSTDLFNLLAVEPIRDYSDLTVQYQVPLSSLGKGSIESNEKAHDDNDEDIDVDDIDKDDGDGKESKDNATKDDHQSLSSISYQSNTSYYSETDGDNRSSYSDDTSYSYITGYYTYNDDHTYGASTAASSSAYYTNNIPSSLRRFGRYLSKTGSAIIHMIPSSGGGYIDQVFPNRDDREVRDDDDDASYSEYTDMPPSEVSSYSYREKDDQEEDHDSPSTQGSVDDSPTVEQSLATDQPMWDDISVFDQGFEVVAKSEDQQQGHLGVSPKASPRDYCHEDAKSVVSAISGGDNGEEIPTIPTSMSIYDQGFEIVAQLITVPEEDIRQDDKDEMTLPSLAPLQPSPGHDDTKTVETLQCQSSTRENMDLSVQERQSNHGSVRVYPSVDDPRGSNSIGRDDAETEPPSLRLYDDMVIEPTTTGFESYVSSDCRAQNCHRDTLAGGSGTQLPSSMMYNDLVVEPVTTGWDTIASSHCAPSGRRGPSTFIGNWTRTPDDVSTCCEDIISSPVKAHHGKTSGCKDRCVKIQESLRMSDKNEQVLVKALVTRKEDVCARTVLGKGKKKDNIIACPRKLRKMDTPVNDEQLHHVPTAVDLQQDVISTPIALAYPSDFNHAVAFILPSPSSLGLMNTSCFSPESYGVISDPDKACLAPTEACNDNDMDRQMKTLLPTLLPSMSLPQEIGPIRRNILMKQFLDDTMSPCTVCFLTLVESLELEFFTPSTKKKRRVVSHDNVVDPGAQIEMVLNEGRHPSSVGKKKNKKKTKKMSKDKKDHVSMLRPSLPRTKRFQSPPLTNPSAVADGGSVALSLKQMLWDKQWRQQQRTRQRKRQRMNPSGRTMTRMTPILEEPRQFREEEEEDTDDNIDLDDRDKSNRDQLSMLMESSNDSMVPKIGSASSF